MDLERRPSRYRRGRSDRGADPRRPRSSRRFARMDEAVPGGLLQHQQQVVVVLTVRSLSRTQPSSMACPSRTRPPCGLPRRGHDAAAGPSRSAFSAEQPDGERVHRITGVDRSGTPYSAWIVGWHRRRESLPSSTSSCTRKALCSISMPAAAGYASSVRPLGRERLRCRGPVSDPCRRGRAEVLHQPVEVFLRLEPSARGEERPGDELPVPVQALSRTRSALRDRRGPGAASTGRRTGGSALPKLPLARAPASTRSDSLARSQSRRSPSPAGSTTPRSPSRASAKSLSTSWCVGT